jgi:hypothetical protein
VISIYQFLATFFLILHYDRVMALISLASAPFLPIMSSPKTRFYAGFP